VRCARYIFVLVLDSFYRHVGGRTKGFRRSEVRLDPTAAWRIEAGVQPTCGFAVIALFPRTIGSRDWEPLCVVPLLGTLSVVVARVQLCTGQTLDQEDVAA